MSLSTGFRHTLAEAASWLTAAAIIVGGVIYREEIQRGIVTLVGIEVAETSEEARARSNEIENRIRVAEERARQAEEKALAAETKARAAQVRTANAPRRQGDSGQSSWVPGGAVELKAGRHGHFHTPASINGRTIDVMVDTGASIVALTYEDAERAGIYVRESDFTHRVSTANGIARVAPVMIDRLEVGFITVRNVQAAVCEPGKLQSTLLGMSFLSRLSRFEIRQGTLILQE